MISEPGAIEAIAKLVKKPPISADESGNIRDLNEELIEIESEERKLETALLEKGQKLEKIKTEQERKERAYEGLIGQVKTITSELEVMNDLVRESTEELGRLKGERDANAREIEVTDDRLSSERKKQLKNRRDLDNAEKLVHEMVGDSERIPRELEEYEMSLRRNNSEIEDHLSKIRGLDVRLASAKNSLEKALGEVSSVEAKLKDNEARLNALSEMQKIYVDCERLEEENSKSEKEFLRLKKCIADERDALEKNTKNSTVSDSVLGSTEQLRNPSIAARFRVYASFGQTPKSLVESGEKYSKIIQQLDLIGEETKLVSRQIEQSKSKLASCMNREGFLEAKTQSIREGIKNLGVEISDTIKSGGYEPGIISLDVPKAVEDAVATNRLKIKSERELIDSLELKKKQLIEKADELSKEETKVRDILMGEEKRFRDGLKGNVLTLQSEKKRCEDEIRALEEKLKIQKEE
ncbi:MAG: hypothetical protein KKD39_06000, partial [Candidatus Altiarchaeota archaeon]|nr:hypothetical protein [Candidatus Altiarchaeota archaeon]